MNWEPEAVEAEAALAQVSELLQHGPNASVDPLSRLLDPSFKDVLWEYEHSSTEPFIPGVMHPKQVEAFRNEKNARFRWLFWGNQTGKTTFGAVDMAASVLGRNPSDPWEPPITCWASALTWDLWEQVLLPELLTWIPRERIIDAPVPKAKSTKRTILVRADNGSISRIVGKSAEQGAAKYQSARVHKVWFDEEHPESIYNEVQPRLLRFGGRVLGTMTPLLGLTWLYHRIYEPWKRGQMPDHWCSHAGLASNPSIGPEEIEALRREMQGDPAQLAARLEGLFTRPAGIAIQFDPAKHFETWGDKQLREAIVAQGWKQFAGVDFGYWRFSFMHFAADRADRGHVISEIFSQKESLEQRARRIHQRLAHYKAPGNIPIWGDAANPTDIRELNKELERIESPYRVRAVAMDKKLRSASVSRINNLLARGALVVRRDLGTDPITGQVQSWRLKQTAASEGSLTLGSRFLYEMNNWRYPLPSEDAAQKQDPDDDTADGADCIAAARYAIMSHWKGPAVVLPTPKVSRNVDQGLEKLAARIQEEMRHGT